MEALGMIETRGMLAAVEALDNMLKAAEVRVVNSVNSGGGFITVLVRGDVGAVQAAVDAGVAAVNALSPTLLKSDNVIPRPESSIASIIVKKEPEAAPDPEEPDPEPTPDNDDDAPEAEEESEVISAENVVSEEAEAPAEEPAEAEAEPADDTNSTEEVPEPQETEPSAEEEAIPAEEETVETAETPAEEAPEEEPAPAEENTAEPEAEAEEPAQAEPKAEAEETAEVSSSGETEVSDPTEEDEVAEGEPESDSVGNTELPQVKDRESIDQMVAEQGLDHLKDVLGGLRVSELRKLARGYKNFSLTGRDISKANKKMLIEAFEEYYK